MKFPGKLDFLVTFGIDPVEEDPSMAYCRYVKRSSDGFHELDISFSAVSESFQVVLRYSGDELITISSESVRLVELWQDQVGSGVHVVFDVQNSVAEAVVTLEPILHCRWWTLRS